MLLILHFFLNFQLLIDKHWFQKISKINEENYKKFNSVFNRPMLILFKYYYCFQRDTSVAQFHGKTVFIL
jgi:hypothetical protein